MIAAVTIVGATETIDVEIETARGTLVDSPQSTRRKRLLKHEDAPKVLAMTLEMIEATEEVHAMTEEADN